MKTIFLVDADDTLLDFQTASKNALQAAFAEYKYPWKEEYYTVFKRVNNGLWEGLERRELTRAELMERRFPLYLKALGISKIDGVGFNRLFLEHLAKNPLYIEGAQAFLRALRRMGKVYIVTNGTGWIQKSRFDIANLWQYAEEVFVSDVIGFDKPAKEYTAYVMAHIPDFKKENAVWIGDSLSSDMQAAKESGITAIWYNPQGKQASDAIRPQYEARSFSDVLKRITAINS